MTIRVRVSRAGDETVTATGATLAQAVRRAAWQLGLPGQTISKERLDSHRWRWVWSARSVSPADVELLVTESRSGPSGASGRRKVLLSLSDEAADRLDVVADQRRETKSAVVEQAILALT